MSNLQDYIREIPDFPKEGIIFRDVMPLFGNAEGLRLATDSIKEILSDTDFDLIAGSEAIPQPPSEMPESQIIATVRPSACAVTAGTIEVIIAPTTTIVISFLFM